MNTVLGLFFVVLAAVVGGLVAKKLKLPGLVGYIIAGIVIGIWALTVMGIGNINISPLVKQGAVLVTRGPYRLIRHPMYLAVLLVIWPLLIIDHFSLLRITAGFVLTTDLIIKMLFEEGLLKKQFAEYKAYMKTTKRLIPVIF